MKILSRFVGEGSTGTQLPIDQTVTLLANERRRKALDLLDHHGAMSVSEMATQMAMAEMGLEQPRNLSGKDRKRVYVALYQAHLSKLSDADVVDLPEGRSGIVEQGENFEAAKSVLDGIREQCGGGA